MTKLREKEAALPVQQTDAHIVSPVFVVPKHRGGWKLIIDLRYLNSCMVPPHFKMEGLFMLPTMVSHRWFMAKLHLKDAYLTIPIAQKSWKLLTFQTGPPHQLMQFRCLPFGLCTAPFAFSKATKPITQFLRQLGIHLIIYLGDLLLAALSREQLLVNLSTAIWLLSNLINISKSITTPTCHLEFLGFVVDTEVMTISLPTHKISAIMKDVTCLLQPELMPVRDLACLIGTLVTTRLAVWTGPLHYHALQDLKIQTLQQHPSYQTLISLSPEVRGDLQWWLSDLSHNCSAMIVKPEASIVIESDASMSGWGAVCQGVTTGGRWTSEEAGFHINWLELQAIFLALQSFLKDKTNLSVLIRSDNRTAIAYLNKMGSPTQSQLCRLALKIWQWCLLRQIPPHVEYLAGKDNVLGDWESRHHDSSDWQLLPSVFNAIHHLLGPFTIDLFASRTNTHLPIYCSWRPDPQTRVVDAFSTSWSRDRSYLFPPFCLIGRTLTKIQLEEVDYACLIAPAWSAQVWYPQVLRMLVKNPVLLPREQDLLLAPDLSSHPLILENQLFLTAWPVSGKISLHRDLLNELRSYSSNLGESIPMQHAIQPGLSGVAGVLEGTSIHFQHL